MRVFSLAVGLLLVVSSTVPLFATEDPAGDSMPGFDDLNSVATEETPSFEGVADAAPSAGAGHKSGDERDGGSVGEDKQVIQLGTTGGESLRLEIIRDKSGRAGEEKLYVGSHLVDSLRTGLFDRSAAPQSFKDDNGKTELVIYSDKSTGRLRANGYNLDLPPDAEIVKVVSERDDMRVVWKDPSGNYKSGMVPKISSGSFVPASGKTISSESLDGDVAEKLGLPGGTDDSTARGKDVDGRIEESEAFQRPGQDAGTGKTNMESAFDAAPVEDPAVNVPPIEEPGNKYGIDPVFSDGDVEKIVNEEIAKARAEYKGPGQLNEWLVVVNNVKTGVIKHTGKIDGQASPVFSCLNLRSGVRECVEQAAKEKRSRLEKEREETIEKLRAEASGAEGFEHAVTATGIGSGPTHPAVVPSGQPPVARSESSASYSQRKAPQKPAAPPPPPVSGFDMPSGIQ